MQTEKIGPILGSTECKYLVPLSFPDEITIGTNVTQVRDKRFTMHYEVFSNKLSKIASTGSGEIIYFDYNINKTTKIPNIILGQIDKLSC